MKNLALIILLLFSHITTAGKDIPKDSQDRAQGMADVVNKQMGSGESIRRFASAPLTSDQKMTTLDGKSEFDFTMKCEASEQFLKLMVQPKGNGNVVLRTINQDTTMDGSYDTVMTPNMEMSGICSNGFLSCTDPKNGEGCTNYKWSTTPAGMIIPTKAPISELGGCYCIANDCGSNLAWNNLDIILRDLGTGAAGALTAFNPFYTVTDLQIKDVVVTASGSNGESCSAATGTGSNPSDLKNANYKANPASLNADGYASSKSNVWYNNISNHMADTSFKVNSCTIQRTVQQDKADIYDIIGLDSGSSTSGGFYIYDHETARIVLGKEGNNYWKGSCAYFNEKTAFYVKRPDRIKSATLKKAFYDDWIQLSLNGGHVWNGPYGTWTDIGSNVPGNCELGVSWKQDIHVDFTHQIDKPGKYNFDVRVEVSGKGEGYIVGEIKVNNKCEILDDYISNTCQHLQTNKDCTLLEEVVDGVTTYRNGHSTGLSPLPSSAGVFCGVNQVRDWFTKQRKYQCKDKGSDFDEGIKRAEYIKDSLQPDGKYQDKRKLNSGEFVFDNGKVTTFNYNGSSCINSCKTKKKRPASEIALESPTNSKQVEDDAYDYFYYECINDTVCPAGTGETIIKSCGCLNDFNEAAAAMQVLRMAGQDMICSDGTRGLLE